MGNTDHPEGVNVMICVIGAAFHISLWLFKCKKVPWVICWSSRQFKAARIPAVYFSCRERGERLSWERFPGLQL